LCSINFFTSKEVEIKITEVIVSQYLAALEMLKQTIVKCPEEIWNDPADKNKFWQVAYHAIFYIHLYLQDSEITFEPWYKHREEYQFLGHVPWSSHAAPRLGEPYNKATVLEYLAFCQQQVRSRVPHIDLEGMPGFYWLPFSNLELQIYSIRHAQQHTGELMERLGTRADLELDWIGTIPAEG